MDIQKEKEMRPFTKDFLLSRFNLDLFEFPEIVDNDGVERTNTVSKEIERLMDARSSIDRNVLLGKLSATGIVGVSISGVVSGGQYSWMMVARMIEALSKDVNYTLTNYLPQMLVCQSVMNCGDDNQKERYIRSLANGELKGCLALSEGVSDTVNIASVSTTASMAKTDGSWILNGYKTRIFNYNTSDVIIVWAMTPSGEVVPFIVDSKSKGISQNDNGTKKLHTELNFVNVEVPRDNLLSSKCGIKIARRISSMKNMSISAICTSLTKSLIHHVNDFVCSRHIFGKALSQYQTTEAKIVDLTLEAYSTESVTYLLAGMLDNDLDGDLFIESTMAKVYSLESLRRCLDTSMRIIGSNFLNNPTFKVLFDESNILLSNQVSPVLSRLDSTNETIQYVVEQIKVKKFSLYERVCEIIGNYKIKGYLQGDIIANSFKCNLHQRLGGLADTVYDDYYTLTKLLEKMSTSDDLLRDDYCLNILSAVLVDSFVMVAVLGRSSRSICIGLRNHDHEVRLAEIICGRICARIKRKVSILKKYPDNVNLWNKVASLIRSDMPNFMTER